MAGYTAFDRKHLSSVVTELRSRFPNIQVRAAGLTFSRMGRKKHYFFQYFQFAWDGVAENAYAARAAAWTAYMNRQGALGQG